MSESWEWTQEHEEWLRDWEEDSSADLIWCQTLRAALAEIDRLKHQNVALHELCMNTGQRSLDHLDRLRFSAAEIERLQQRVAGLTDSAEDWHRVADARAEELVKLQQCVVELEWDAERYRVASESAASGRSEFRRMYRSERGDADRWRGLCKIAIESESRQVELEFVDSQGGEDGEPFWEIATCGKAVGSGRIPSDAIDAAIDALKGK